MTLNSHIAMGMKSGSTCEVLITVSDVALTLSTC